MRGKEAPGRLCSDGRGITPAYAGKSCRSAAQPRAGRDHPRVCGEKPDAPSLCVAPLGSPPRMRGKVYEQMLAQAGR